jgi:L-aspartate oxidase
MVFGPRVIEAIGKGVAGPEPTGAMRAVLDDEIAPDAIGGRRISIPDPVAAAPAEGDPMTMRSTLQRTMTRCAGVLRSAASLEEATATVESVRAGVAGDPASPAAYELVNLVTVADALLTAARTREETRGCHTRQDFPDTSAHFHTRLVV